MMTEIERIASEIYWKLQAELGFGTLTMCHAPFSIVTYSWTFECNGEPMGISEAYDMYTLELIQVDRLVIRLAEKWKESFRRTENPDDWTTDRSNYENMNF